MSLQNVFEIQLCLLSLRTWPNLFSHVIRGRLIFFMNFCVFLTELCWKAAALSRPLMAVDGVVSKLDGAPPVMAALAVMAYKGVYHLVDV
jgi:hypothetical protein